MTSQRPNIDRRIVDETAELGNTTPPTLPPADKVDGNTQVGSTSGTIGSTVLPEVKVEGDQLTFKPREQLRYEEDALLGRGGMGVVQLARDHDIGRQVAVKRLLDEKDPRALARFIDEVRTVGSLEHPNIVPIHDVGIDSNGSLFFVMKYVEGETLASVIDKLGQEDKEYHRRFPIEARLDLFIGLLQALHYAHDQGLLHCDIKPENIMVGKFGEVVLMDWGVSRKTHGYPVSSSNSQRTSSETNDGTIIGTPRYMSPEQAAGDSAQVDIRSDLYSSFIVLYELLTTQPYMKPNASAMQSVIAARECTPPKIHDPAFDKPHHPAVSAELRHFLRRGLARAKDQRFADANQVLEELGRIRSGNCAVQCPLTFVKATNSRYVRLLDRHPLVGMLASLLVVAACASGLVTWVVLLRAIISS